MILLKSFQLVFHSHVGCLVVRAPKLLFQFATAPRPASRSNDYCSG